MGIIIIVIAAVPASVPPRSHSDAYNRLCSSYRSQHISYRGHSRVAREESNWKWVERDKHSLERVEGKPLNSGGEWCFSLMNSVPLPFLRKENLICIKYYNHFGTCLMQWAR